MNEEQRHPNLKGEQREWFRLLLQLRGSVIPAILPRVIFCGVFSLFISLIYSLGINIALPTSSSIVPSIVLGLLLVFRTNTAYERFWEGRKVWGVSINTIRNFSRTMWVAVAEREPGDRQDKIVNLHLLLAFAVATKLHLRGEAFNKELEELIPEKWHEKLKLANNYPLEIAFWIGDYLQHQYERGCIHAYQLTAMLNLLDTMVDSLGACERILKTPIPLAYSIHLKQLLLLYCLTLPFELVDELHWGTAFIVSLICFTIFGIEEIGIEIENPFGHDANDLPLDDICNTMKINLENLMNSAPSVRFWKDCRE